jgi:hypothetical protein
LLFVYSKWERLKINNWHVINNKIIEQRMDFMYLGSHTSPFEYQKNIEKNLMRYNKLNGVLRRNFGGRAFKLVPQNNSETGPPLWQ